MENKLVQTLLRALLHTLVTIGKFFLRQKQRNRCIIVPDL